jgi:DNA repair photolyase
MKPEYRLEFQEYQVRKIVNVHKHVNGPWFWGKYTAHPYVGCRSGCEFCYNRGSRYLGRRDPNTFDTLIQVNALFRPWRSFIGRNAAGGYSDFE